MDLSFDEITKLMTSTSETMYASKLPFKRSTFYSTYHQQQVFTFPYFMIQYIVQNPKTPKFYQKMIKTCKYFFVKNPIIIINCLYFELIDNQWLTCLSKNGYPYSWNRKKLAIDTDNILCKFWVTNFLEVNPPRENQPDKNLLKLIIPKIYRCDAWRLQIWKQYNITFDEYKHIASKAKDIWMGDMVIKFENGIAVPIEKLVEASSPDINHFGYTGIPGIFDIDNFYTFIKKNTKTRIEVHFLKDPLSDEYKAGLQAIVDEILATLTVDVPNSCLS